MCIKFCLHSFHIFFVIDVVFLWYKIISSRYKQHLASIVQKRDSYKRNTYNSYTLCHSYDNYLDIVHLANIVLTIFVTLIQPYNANVRSIGSAYTFICH